MTLKDIHEKLVNGEQQFVINNDITILSMSTDADKNGAVRVYYTYQETKFNCVFSKEAFESSDLVNLLDRFPKETKAHLRADKTLVASFRMYTQEEIITAKTLISNLPYKFKDIAYSLYVNENRVMNTKVLSAVEFRLKVNKALCDKYINKVKRALNININPKGTFDTTIVFKKLNFLANAAATNKKKTVFSNKNWLIDAKALQEDRLDNGNKVIDAVNKI